jgi:vitamin K-dependent gamma-carboxylase
VEKLPGERSTAESVFCRPVDAASVAVFRIGLGILLSVGTLRFVVEGWIEALYIEPSFFFRYHGFEWVPIPGPEWLYPLYAVLFLLGLAFAAGFHFRLVAVLLFLGFSWVELIDVTNYLNHYYLVSLVLFLAIFLPIGSTWSLDARRRPSHCRDTVPAWVLYLLRFQVGVVYVFAGLAKLGSDWLLYAQPLGIWLAARDEMPIVGAWFDAPWVPFLASWAGVLFDTCIVPLLLWRRTRTIAFCAIVAFHFGTYLLFDIGLFPFLMPLLATLFFSPEWPRRILGWFGKRPMRVPSESRTAALPSVGRRRFVIGAVSVYVAVQLLLPIRSFIYGGDVLWHEQGMRWSWKVMVREKNGSIVYRVRNPQTGREWQVGPMRYLTWRQASEMTGQPDLILQLAHHIADEFRTKGLGPVEVRVDAMVSLNGRRAARLIDPDADLARVSDGLAPAPWILPMRDQPPLAVSGSSS